MGRLRLKRGAHAVWVLNAALAAGALALYHHVAGLSAPVPSVHIPWWALALAFAVTEIAVVHVHFRRSSHALTLGELPLVVGLLFCAPGEVMLAWVAGAALVLVFTPGRVPLRVAFNLAQLAVTAGIARAVFHAVGRGAARARPARLARRHRRRAAGGRRLGAARQRGDVALGGSHRATQARHDRRDVDLRRGDQHEPRAGAGDGGGHRHARGRAAARAGAGRLPRLPRAPLPSGARPHLAFLHEASQTLSTASDAAAGLAGLLRWRWRTSAARWPRSASSRPRARARASGSRSAARTGWRSCSRSTSMSRELRELTDRDAAARLVTSPRRAARSPATCTS